MAKTTSKKSTKTQKASSKKGLKNELSEWIESPRQSTTMNDVKIAVLIVSLTINLAIFIGWLALRLTTVYDQEVFNFLFTR